MVKLRDDKDVSPNIVQQNQITKSVAERSREEAVKVKNSDKNDEVAVDLNKFSQTVLKQLSDDNIQATPENFDIYFRKLLESKSSSFQKKF